MVDRVDTTGTVWLGLTVGCAQCHTHKFDPIPHRDYYQFMAFLNNADETELDVPDPAPDDPRPRDRNGSPPPRPTPDRFPPGGRTKAGAKFEKRFARVGRDGIGPRRTLDRLQPAKRQGQVAPLDRRTPTIRSWPAAIRARAIATSQFRKRAEPRSRPCAGGAARRSLPNTGRARIFYEGPFGDFHLSEFTATADGVAVHFQGGGPVIRRESAARRRPSTAIRSHRGRSTEDRANRTRPSSCSTSRSRNVKISPCRCCSSATTRPAWDVFAFPRPRPPSWPIGRCFRPRSRSAAHPGRAPEAEQKAAVPLFARSCPSWRRPARDRQSRKAVPALPTSLVMSERPADNPRPTFVHKRGEFLQPTERVEPGLPAFRRRYRKTPARPTGVGPLAGQLGRIRWSAG